MSGMQYNPHRQTIEVYGTTERERERDYIQATTILMAHDGQRKYSRVISWVQCSRQEGIPISLLLNIKYVSVDVP